MHNSKRIKNMFKKHKLAELSFFFQKILEIAKFPVSLKTLAKFPSDIGYAFGRSINTAGDHPKFLRNRNVLC